MAVDASPSPTGPQGAPASDAAGTVLFAQLPHGVVYQDASGRITAANAAASNILGLSLDQLQGRTSVDPRWLTVHEDGSPYPGQDHPAMVTLRTGRPLRGALMGVYRPDEAMPRWIEIDTIPDQPPGAPAPVGVYAIFTDVTARREAENAVRRHEAVLREAFEHSPVALIDQDLSDVKAAVDALVATGVSDITGHLSRDADAQTALLARVRMNGANDAALRFFDAPTCADLERQYAGVFDEASLAVLVPTLEFMVRDGVCPEFECPIRHASGRRRVVLVRQSVRPGHEATLASVFVSLVDVTAVREAEAALRASQARYRDLFENSPVPVWEEDFSEVRALMDGWRAAGVADLAVHLDAHPDALAALVGAIRIVDVNTESLRFFGVASREDLPLALSKYFDEASWPVLREEMLGLWRGLSRMELEVPIRDLQGRHRLLLLKLSIRPGFEQTWQSVLVTFVDITTRHLAEQQATAIAVISGLFLGDRPLPEIFQEVARRVADLSGFEFVAVELYHAATQEIEYVANVGMAGVAPGFRVPVRQSRSSQVHLTGQAIVVQAGGNEVADEDETLRGLSPVAFVSVPIGSDGEVIGALSVVDRRPCDDLGAIVGLASAVANSMAIEIRRRRAKEALRESQAALARLMGNLPGLAYRCSSEPPYDLQFVSDGCLDLTGYTPEEFLAKGIEALAADAPEAWEQTIQETRRAIEQRRGYNFTYQLRTKAGELKWVWEQGTGVWADDGTLVALEGLITDVSERARAEEALRASERRFRAFVDNSAVVAWMKDEAGRHVFWSDNYERCFGRRLEDFGQPTDFDLFPADVAEIMLADDAAVLASSRPAEFVERAVSAKGVESWWYTNKFPFVDEHGRRFVGGLAVDVTDRTRADAVRSAWLKLLRLPDATTIAEMLRAALDEAEALTHSTVGFFHFVEADQKTLSLQAWSTNTRRVCSADGDGVHYAVEQAGVWADAIREGRVVVHNDLASTAGRKGLPEGHAPLARELVAPVSRGGRIVAVIGVGNKSGDYDEHDVRTVADLADLAWDIVDRKRAEAALKESERRFRDVTFTAADWAWEVDTRGHYTFASENVAKTLGYEASHLIGRSAYEFMPAAEAERVRPVFEAILARRARYSGIEVAHVHRDGGLRHLVGSGVPVFDQSGTLVGYRGTSNDVTDKRAAELQLRQAQKMDAVGRLAGGVAHDFNNILASMMMQIGLLRESETATPDVLDGLEELEREAEHAATLTRQLLLFSRREVAQVHVFDLNETVDRLVRMLRRLLGEHIELVLRDGSVPLWVEADAGMMEQVVMNLSINARDAMPSGGRLTLSLASVDVNDRHVSRVPQARPGRFVRIAVQDTGCGMDEATRQRVFEPFFTTKEVGKGTGLGLATVFGIVDGHHGWIEVESTPGVGSTFRVYLPAARPPVAAAARLATSPVGGQETLLLVEDEAALRRLLGMMLRRQGYTVVEAADGVDAIREWERLGGRVDLLLTDMVMPAGMSGLDLAARLRADRPDLKVIICSGYTASTADAFGPTIQFLEKPYEASHLMRLVREVLDRRV